MARHHKLELPDNVQATRMPYKRRHRVDRRHKLKLPRKRRGKDYSATPTGEIMLATFAKPLAKHLVEVLDEAPGGLGPILRQLPPEELAQTALIPLRHRIAIGWQRGKGVSKNKVHDWRRECVESIGRNLYELLLHKQMLATGVVVTDMRPRLKPPKKRHRRKPGEPARKRGRKPQADAIDLTRAGWDAMGLHHVGYWLFVQAMRMPYFTYRRSRFTGMPDIAPGWVGKEAAIRRRFVEADKDLLPLQEPPPDWVGMKNGRLSFISGNHPECRAALTSAFERGAPAIVRHVEPDGTVIEAQVEESDNFLEHVAAVNALQRVPLRINPFVLGLVKEFGVKLLDRETTAGIKGDDKKSERKRAGLGRRNYAIVSEDIEFAEVILERGTFYNPHRIAFSRRFAAHCPIYPVSR
jgi:hypothetical protein